MQLYFRLLRYARPYLGRVIGAMLCLALTAGLTAVGMYLIKPVLDQVFNNPDQAQALFYLRLVPVAIVVTYFLKGFATYGQDYLINHIGNRIVMDIRNQLYAHLMTQELSFFHGQRSGMLISRVTHDSTLMQAAVSNVLGRMLGAVLTSVSLIALLTGPILKSSLQGKTLYVKSNDPTVHFRLRRGRCS